MVDVRTPIYTTFPYRIVPGRLQLGSFGVETYAAYLVQVSAYTHPQQYAWVLRRVHTAHCTPHAPDPAEGRVRSSPLNDTMTRLWYSSPTQIRRSL
jgi:hypothetical protein